MMYFYRLFLFSIIFLFPVSLISQPLEWMEITDDYELPEGLRFFGHSFEDSNIEAWYLELDLNENGLAVEAIPGSDFQSISDYDDKEGVYAAVNGGYFAGEDVVSAVVTPDGDVPTRNIATLNRDGNTHHVTRSMFSLDDEIKPSVDWIYHHGLNVDDIYRYEEPLPNAPGEPSESPPAVDDGEIMEGLATGIGGGPVLITEGEENITHDDEVFFGSGIQAGSNRARTAVGYTEDNRVIMMVVSEAGSSTGVTLSRLAEELLELDVVAAMNLDGGGSSQMTLDQENILSTGRSIPNVLAVVSRGRVTSAAVTGDDELPRSVRLHQNHPNPFNPDTSIPFSIDHAVPVTLTIYDMTGRKVATVIQNETYSAGRHSVRFDASELSTGTYVYRLSTPEMTRSRLMTLIR